VNRSSAPAIPQALGAHLEATGTRFRVWAPRAKAVEVVFYQHANGADRETGRRPLAPQGDGLFEALVPGIVHGQAYKFALDGEVFPDPYARYLPQGVHGPAIVWDEAYRWRHEAPGTPLSKMVVYELHIGTFTPEGTFEAAAAKLPELQALGVTALEVMPIAAFPGARGWGYDGVSAFAPYAPYGDPDAVKAFVDAAHGLGLAVLLDAVYNHFGPDGNYLYAYSPSYFTHDHTTPWGDAIDYAQPYARQLVLDAAWQWLTTYRFDGLRLDATHHIVDDSPVHVLKELVTRLEDAGLEKVLVAEDDRNAPALVTETGLDGLWADDFHHGVRVLLTGEQDGYYAAYRPSVEDLAATIRQGWLYTGQAWPLDGHARGASADALGASSFVYAIQNHDQIGNRAAGDRLTDVVGTEAYLAASALMLFLPMTPLLFQGQEWAASTPFAFFSDHAGDLGRAVSEGRAREFAHFSGFAGTVPDPQAAATFASSKLDWAERETGSHRRVLEAYRVLLALRRHDPVLSEGTRDGLSAVAEGDVLRVTRRHAGSTRVLLVNFGETTPLPTADAGRRKFFTNAPMPDGQLIRHGAVILEGDPA
jgi:maltooligosyltrehalose trehalohydrolase